MNRRENEYRMLSAEEATALMAYAALAASRANSRAIYMRPVTFVNVLRSPIGCHLLQWQAKRDLTFAPFFNGLEVKLTAEVYATPDLVKTTAPIGHSLKPRDLMHVVK